MSSNNNTSNRLGGHALSGPKPKSIASVAGCYNHHDHASSSVRKPKKPKIPKRGPGVAALEKMLQEQKGKCGVEKRISIPSLPLTRNTYLRPRPSNFASSSASNLPTTIPLISGNNSDVVNNPTAALVAILPTGNGNVIVNDNLKGSSQFGGGSRSKGVFIYQAGIYLPEKALLPVSWSSYETTRREESPTTDSDFSFPILVSNGLDQSQTVAHPMFQNSHGSSDYPSMMNKFPWSTVIASSSIPSSSSAGAYRHEERPSSQKSCQNHTSALPEGDKMIGAKRPNFTFSVDNWSTAPPPALPGHHPTFRHTIHRLDPSSSSINHGVVNLATSSRNPMPSSYLELMPQICVNDHGNTSGSGGGSTLGSPTTPFPSTENYQPEFSKFKPFSFQEMKENTVQGLLHQMPSSSSSGAEGSVHQKKSFISFLIDPEEQSGDAEAEASLSGLINEKFTEEGEEFIDLNLKL